MMKTLNMQQRSLIVSTSGTNQASQEITVFPNGLCSCPRKFTKLFKPVLATLRLKRHIIIIYIDDLFLVGHSYEQCVHTVIETLYS
jgi:hypothetical protein